MVRAAAAGPHWREVYACTPIGDRLLEGYVDLLYRGDDGLVVVDHKTSGSADPAELDRRVEGYRLQGAAYAVAVGAPPASRSSASSSCSSPPRAPSSASSATSPPRWPTSSASSRQGQELVTP